MSTCNVTNKPINNSLNPFDENIVADAKLPVEIHSQLKELSADQTLQLEFSSQDLNKFWLAR
jgi:hypothetical protein